MKTSVVVGKSIDRVSVEKNLVSQQDTGQFHQRQRKMSFSNAADNSEHSQIMACRTRLLTGRFAAQ